MMTLAIPTLLVSALALSLTAQPARPPIVIRHDASDEESRELAERFDATVACVPDGCGTLIGSRWVLTAAHVGRGLSPFSPRVRLDGKELRVRQVLLHPESKSDGRRPPRVDLALVELEEEVKGIEPVALYPGNDEVGQEVIVVGYGDYGPAGSRLVRGDGTRRAATNRVEAAERGRLHLTFDAPPQGTALEGVGGPGDSGGPLYLETEEGLFLAGVSTASMGGRPGSYGVVDLYVRVSELTDWIDRTRAESAGKPPVRPDVRDLDDGFPEGDRGDLVAAFFEAFALAEEEAVRDFAEAFRSSGSRRRNPADAFVRRVLSLVGELGSLTPERVALVDERKWVVLARAEKGGWRAVHFRFDLENGGARLADFGIRPEEKPQEK